MSEGTDTDIEKQAEEDDQRNQKKTGPRQGSLSSARDSLPSTAADITDICPAIEEEAEAVAEEQEEEQSQDDAWDYSIMSDNKSSNSAEDSESTPLLGKDGSPGFAVIARWLLLPSLFVICHWFLLLFTGIVLSIVPQLWTPALRAPEAFLLPIPKNRVQVFDLGEKVHYFTEHCKEGSLDQACEDVLKDAAEILGVEKPLTATQLLGERAYLADLDEQRSVADRVLGFLSFVNILWLLGIAGIVCTVGPCIAYMIGPMLRDYAVALLENILRPAAIYLHEIGAWEVLAYLTAFLLSVEGARYPQATDAGINVSLTGGLLFLPCWAYSTSLHMSAKGGDTNKFLMLSHFMVALIMIPLALVHQSSLLGFLAVLAVYGGLGFIFVAFGCGFLIGFDSEDALNRCVFASVVLIVAFTSFRVMGLSPSWVKPFMLGGMCLGNIMYFLALLIASGSFRLRNSDWRKMQIIMIVSLLSALFVGSVYAIPAMTNTALTFLVLYCMEKQLEVQWQAFGIVVVFLNCLALFAASLWLNHHPEFIISMFDAKGMYS